MHVPVYVTLSERFPWHRQGRCASEDSQLEQREFLRRYKNIVPSREA